MRFSVLRNMLLKSQDLYNYPILEPRRSDRGGVSKKLQCHFFDSVQKSCDWSVSKHGFLCFLKVSGAYA
jgi:hypothetical protein